MKLFDLMFYFTDLIRFMIPRQRGTEGLKFSDRTWLKLDSTTANKMLTTSKASTSLLTSQVSGLKLSNNIFLAYIEMKNSTSADEFRSIHLGGYIKTGMGSTAGAVSSNNLMAQELPSSVDWRTKGVISDIKNQVSYFHSRCITLRPSSTCENDYQVK